MNPLGRCKWTGYRDCRKAFGEQCVPLGPPSCSLDTASFGQWNKLGQGVAAGLGIPHGTLPLALFLCDLPLQEVLFLQTAFQGAAGPQTQ